MADEGARPSVARIDLASEPDFLLGGMQVEPSGRAVRMNGEREELQPRVMQVLVALARVRPHVVSRDALIEQCWEGRVVGEDAINRCIVALRHLAREFAPEPFSVETVPRVGYRLTETIDAQAPASAEAGRRTSRLVYIGGAVGLAAAAALALAALRPWQTEARPTTVFLTTPANGTASRALVRDLAVRLGSLQPQLAAMRLVSEERVSPRNADLILEVEGSDASQPLKEAVALKAQGNRSILWSQSFGGGNREDLRQQATYATAAALRCAGEAMASPRPLSEQHLGAYINACIALLETGNETRNSIQMLEGVVRASPRFSQGWAKLLATEADAITDVSNDDGAKLRPAIARHIAEARKVDPNLAEAYLAEAYLMSDIDFAERSRRFELAVARDPSNARARAILVQFLISTGQVNRAVSEARRAAEIDPLSPFVRTNYALALAIRGRTDAARSELAEAQRLWPTSTSVRDIRYIHYLRFDDPREGLRMLQSDQGNPGGALLEKFLQARIDRSPSSIEAAIAQGRVYFKNQPQAISFHAQTLAEFDRTNELLDILMNWRHKDITSFATDVIFRPAFADLHRDPRFMQAAQRLGLLDYWRGSGNWPDFCFDPDLPYDCKAEAAKVGRQLD